MSFVLKQRAIYAIMVSLASASGALTYYVNEPVDTLVICELTNIKPFYDCPEIVDGKKDGTGEVWTIHMYNGDSWRNCSQWHSDSCARWWMGTINTKVIHINLLNQKWTDPCGRNLLTHELAHEKYEVGDPISCHMR